MRPTPRQPDSTSARESGAFLAKIGYNQIKSDCKSRRAGYAPVRPPLSRIDGGDLVDCVLIKIGVVPLFQETRKRTCNRKSKPLLYRYLTSWVA